MPLSDAQRSQLIAPINPVRVLKRSQAGKTFSYLAQHDVRAHLIRLFGFGGFDIITDESVIEYAEKDERGRWVVGCRAKVTVMITGLAEYSDVAFAEATGPNRGQATDQALKSAQSDAMKRACVNLGDQFGLSLYNDGSVRPIVKGLVSDPVSTKLAEVTEAPVDAETVGD